ncbi:hypothetical protein V5O48_015685, partial [Marasmius crinis-equi]
MVLKSIGLAVTTIPVAMFSERYGARRWPLIFGICLLIGAMIMMMEARVFWLMGIARGLQGFASTFVWVCAMALLCDTIPEKDFGKYMGLAMSGVSVGFLAGPPIGGVLYQRFGIRGACIFAIGGALLDLIGWILVIERRDAIKYGFDPQGVQDNSSRASVVSGTDSEKASREAASPAEAEGSTETPVEPTTSPPLSEDTIVARDPPPKKNLSFFTVVMSMCKSPRAWTPIVCIFIDGVLVTVFESALPVYMNQVWGFNSEKVGLVFVAAVVPSFVANPITGTLGDKLGVAPVLLAGVLLGIPFWIALTFKILPLFIVSYAVQFFFINGSFAPLTAELARESMSMEGVG